MIDELFEIDLEQYYIEKKAFYEKIVELISRNNGWVNFRKAVFDSEVERDYALLELEQIFGIAGEEIKYFKNDAKVLYETLKQLAPPDREFTEEENKKLREVFLEILLLEESEIVELLKHSELYIKGQQKSKQIKEIINYYQEFENKSPYLYQNFLKIKSIDEKINKIFFKKI